LFKQDKDIFVDVENISKWELEVCGVCALLRVDEKVQKELHINKKIFQRFSLMIKKIRL